MRHDKKHPGAGFGRREFLAWAGTVGAAAALSACTTPGARNGTGSGTRPGQPVTFWTSHSGALRDVELELVHRFEAENDATVNLVNVGATHDEVAQAFSTALAEGELPDVVVLPDVRWFDFALHHQIEPLDLRSGDFVDALLDDYLFDGRHYAVPYARSTPLFYYNKDLWSRVGLPDRGPESWDEFGEWAPELQRLSGPDKFAHSWGNAGSYLPWMFQGPIWSFGGAYSHEWELTLTDESTLDAGDWLRNQIHEARYARVSPDVSAEFAAGLCASIVGSTNSLSRIMATATTFEVGAAFLPRSGGTICPTGGAGLAIPAGISDDRKENALEFIEFITDADNTAYFSQILGYMPVRKSAVDSAEFAQYLQENPNSHIAVEQLAFTRRQDYARAFVPGADGILRGALERIALHNAEVEPTFAAAQQQLQQIIDRDIAPMLPR